MRDWRRRIHRRPGLGFEVAETAEMVAGVMRQLGVDEVYEGIGGSGVVGVLRSRSSDRVEALALRADMDGLPINEAPGLEYRSEINGAFHGCGHDGHTAMLLGAAAILSARREELPGDVVLIFQPNEENGRGAQAMLDDGLFERFPVSAIYGLHNRPGLAAGNFATRVGPRMSSEDLFEIVISGRGGHASMPQLHVDPVVIAGQLITALQTIVARSISPTDVAVVSITDVRTDGARNIVPSTVTISGDCRSFEPPVQAAIETRMRALVEGICAGHGATAAVSYRNEFVPLVNTEQETQRAIRAARRVVGSERVEPDCALWTASEDFAQFLRHVPGCYLDIGNGEHGRCASSLHNPSYDFNDDISATGASFFVELSLSRDR